ncbi:MAG: CDP-diacylglycerol--serine O-phosphatidyltransferase [Bacteroidales bacterium]|nr:CDP-diacylglycerol--serine O-phosphatidyltransferase [Bacteroidales bacterium]MCF8338523.1 CDP-diacylglycerol--serine O-phosphatidyltransferase [Bacteroidales bacterium]
MKKHIPNFVTSLNLFFGVLAIIYAGKDMLTLSSLFIGLAAIMDFFDGLVARWLSVSSAIGKELDSLADIVSFGVAPGLIAFQMIKETGATVEIASVNVVPFIGLLIPVFSALRLAKFNIDTTQSESFKGLPVPANAIFFASFPVISSPVIFKAGVLHQSFTPLLDNGLFLVILVVIFSLLLVIPFRLFSLKFKNFDWKTHKIQFIFLLIALVSLIVFNFAAVPLIIGLYILLSLLFLGD